MIMVYGPTVSVFFRVILLNQRDQISVFQTTVNGKAHFTPEEKGNCNSLHFRLYSFSFSLFQTARLRHDAYMFIETKERRDNYLSEMYQWLTMANYIKLQTNIVTNEYTIWPNVCRCPSSTLVCIFSSPPQSYNNHLLLCAGQSSSSATNFSNYAHGHCHNGTGVSLLVAVEKKCNPTYKDILYSFLLSSLWQQSGEEIYIK